MPRTLLFLACATALLLVPACGADAPVEPATKPAAKQTPEPAPAEAGPPTVTATWRGTDGTLQFTASGMNCSGCSSTVKSRLGGLDGIDAVTADHKTDVVEIELAADADVEALKPLIVKALEAPESGKKFKLVRATP